MRHPPMPTDDGDDRALPDIHNDQTRVANDPDFAVNSGTVPRYSNPTSAKTGDRVWRDEEGY